MTRTTGLILAISLLLPAAALAETVGVRSGDHPGFTRLVVELAPQDDWVFGRVDGGFELRPGRSDVAYALTRVYDKIGHTRIEDVHDLGDGRLQLGVRCDCHAAVEVLADGQVVIDIVTGPAPAPGTGVNAALPPFEEADTGMAEDIADPQGGSQSPNTSLGQELLEVSFNHPVRLIANALGTAPPEMIAAGKKHGIPVAALVGAKEHAMKQIDAGVDIIVAQGGEGGGHCGEVSTIVLIPEVLQAIEEAGSAIPVLAAGGIMNGRQMAGMMAMGAAGAWCGSVWLASPEAETTEVFREKMVAATSRDTIRSKYRTGKYSRQLRSAWHAMWEDAGLAALPMPLMSLLSEPVLRALDKASVNGNPKAQELSSYWVGQGVGLVREIRGTGAIVQDFKEEFAAGFETLAANFD